MHAFYYNQNPVISLLSHSYCGTIDTIFSLQTNLANLFQFSYSIYNVHSFIQTDVLNHVYIVDLLVHKHSICLDGLAQNCLTEKHSLLEKLNLKRSYISIHLCETKEDWSVLKSRSWTRLLIHTALSLFDRSKVSNSSSMPSCCHSLFQLVRVKELNTCYWKLDFSPLCKGDYLYQS